MSTVEDRWAAEPYCYLTTIGRTSGRPHEIEIWFAPVGDTIYLMNGSGEGVTAGQADWVKNLQANPAAHLRIGDEAFEGVARALEFDSAEHERARDLLVAKYEPGSGDLSKWRATGFPVAIALRPSAASV
jgi:deazaflavin-dependent oxidoreductase (nitroreductase family)